MEIRDEGHPPLSFTAVSRFFVCGCSTLICKGGQNQAVEMTTKAITGEAPMSIPCTSEEWFASDCDIYRVFIGTLAGASRADGRNRVSEARFLCGVLAEKVFPFGSPSGTHR